MTTQQNLKHRLQSTQNILHITQAMEVVASVRYRKLTHKIEHFQFYADKMSEVMSHLQLSSGDESHPLFQSRLRKKIGVIIVTADKGLCGSYNDNVLKEAEKFLKGFDLKEIELIPIGHKSVEYFKKRAWNIKASVPEFSRQLVDESVKKLSNELIGWFEEEAFDELWIVSTHFKNMLSRKVEVQKLLPLVKPEIETQKSAVDFIFEPQAQAIYQEVVPYYFYIKLQSFLFDAMASELSSRMTAMKSAAKNAEEMIEKLTLIKNKNRQLSITREILEITAGAESLQ